jgi:DNA ligase (NAD+)
MLIAEPKIDGLSFSARYENGVYVQGLTRGDGESGELATEQLAGVRDWPMKLEGDFPEVFEPRGEVYMTHDNFRLLNVERTAVGEPLFANCRNAAAGSLRQIDPAVTAKRRLDYMVHGWGEISPDHDLGDSYFDFKTRIASWGLKVVPSYVHGDVFDHNLNRYVG